VDIDTSQMGEVGVKLGRPNLSRGRLRQDTRRVGRDRARWWENCGHGDRRRAWLPKRRRSSNHTTGRAVLPSLGFGMLYHPIIGTERTLYCG
jgi:hypothetical protein